MRRGTRHLVGALLAFGLATAAGASIVHAQPPPDEPLGSSTVEAAGPASADSAERAVFGQLAPVDPTSTPEPAEGPELVRSNPQVRAAVIGLLAVAVVTWVITVVYWYQTGRDAKRRFARDHLRGRSRPAVDPEATAVAAQQHTPSGDGEHDEPVTAGVTSGWGEVASLPAESTSPGPGVADASGASRYAGARRRHREGSGATDAAQEWTPPPEPAQRSVFES